MATRNQNWDELGKNIQDIVNQAINTQDYTALSRSIQQTVSKAVDLGGETVRRVVTEATAVKSQSAPKPAPKSVPRPAPTPKPAAPALSTLYGRMATPTAVGILKTVGGSLLLLMLLLKVLVGWLLGMLGGGVLSFGFGSVILGLGGCLLFGSGVADLAFLERFRSYRRTLGQKTYCTLERLARSVRKKEKFVRRDLQRMIDKGLFRQGHLDWEQATLITSDETYHYFEQSRLQMEETHRQQEAARLAAAKAEAERPKQDPQVQEVLDKGSAFVTQIRQCNDRIPGPEISAKIDYMEQLVRRIFQRVETQPDCVSDLKKLMGYYLPMTVKLLNAYADMDEQPVQGQNILSAKQEIEQTLDTLNLAFEKLLDELFQDTALDISSDISVLNTLLAQEGLTQDGLNMPKN